MSAKPPMLNIDDKRKVEIVKELFPNRQETWQEEPVDQDCPLFTLEAWKKTRVALIGKGGKQPKQASSYRPICLLNTSAKLLDRVQRKTLLRVASAYRTISTRALHVIIGTPPLHLLAEERWQTHITVGELAERRAHIRNSTLGKWQQLWDETSDVAQWTKRLIPSIREWVDCRHRTTCYFLTQGLSGHGPFRTYRTMTGKIEDAKCLHCDDEDTVEHTIFHCDGWMQYRHSKDAW
nr:unnamed protein product [Callosobruchus chinensis]